MFASAANDDAAGSSEWTSAERSRDSKAAAAGFNMVAVNSSQSTHLQATIPLPSTTLQSSVRQVLKTWYRTLPTSKVPTALKPGQCSDNSFQTSRAAATNGASPLASRPLGNSHLASFLRTSSTSLLRKQMTVALALDGRCCVTLMCYRTRDFARHPERWNRLP